MSRKRISLAVKLYSMLLPIIAGGVVVGTITRTSLQHNAVGLIEAQKTKQAAITMLSLLLVQEDASKTILLATDSAAANARKLEAYDASMRLFDEMNVAPVSPGVRDLVRRLKLISDEIQPLDAQFLEAAMGGKREEAVKLYFDRYEPVHARFEVAARDLIAAADADAVQAAKRMNEQNQASFRDICTALAIGTLVVAAIIFAVARHVSHGLHRAVGLLKKESKTTGASSVRLSIQLRQKSQKLSVDSCEIAASLEEATSALEQIAAMTRKNAETAQQACVRSDTAQKAAASGSHAVDRMKLAIHDIEKTATETAKIVKVIDEIAFQTNLLSLNAAVEAARAGEAGKGFAVVADEVRTLAMRSAEAARTTASLIDGSVQSARNGVTSATEAAKVLGTITAAFGEVNSLIGVIATASQEQSQAVQEVSTTVRQVGEITQQNAANAEEAAHGSLSLNAHAAALKQAVDKILHIVEGGQLDGVPDDTAPKLTADHWPHPMRPAADSSGTPSFIRAKCR